MRRAIVFAASTLLAIAAPSFGAPELEEPCWTAGRLERLDPESRALVIRQGGRPLTFSVTGDARFVQNGRTVPPGGLASDVGREVRVRYTTDAVGRHADRVDLVAPPGGRRSSPIRRPAWTRTQVVRSHTTRK